MPCIIVFPQIVVWSTRYCICRDVTL